MSVISLSPARADAATIACDASWTTNGTAIVRAGATTNTAASACEILAPLNGNGNTDLTTINNARSAGVGFFGVSTWSLVFKSDQTSPPPPAGNTQGGPTGSWNITPFNPNLNYLMVFKDGSGTNLTAFFVNLGFSSGTWRTPFTNPPFTLPGGSASHEVSHWSLFSTPGRQHVPEPATLLLLGTGLAIGARRFRRRLL